MKTHFFIFWGIALLFLIVVLIVYFQHQRPATIVFCIEKIDAVRDNKYFDVKYYFYSQKGGHLQLFTSTVNTPIIEGFVQSDKPVRGHSQFGPLRLVNPVNFSSIESIDIKEWIFLDIGKEYVLQENSSFPVWKIENDEGIISTVFLSFSARTSASPSVVGEAEIGGSQAECGEKTPGSFDGETACE